MGNKTTAWLHAFRLRTLPLALSSIITGTFAAYSYHFDLLLFLLALLTTILLQILSNLANDLGDSEKGTDNDERIGPQRAIQSGMLTAKEIKQAIVVNVVLCLLVGLSLIYFAFGIGILTALFFLLGISAIAAAIKYTIGENAYGYLGFGDLFVLIFFGLVGVYGSYYLQYHELSGKVFLLAISVGCFSVGVLNLNNMRDRENDANSNKNTLVVRMGIGTAKIYHAVLTVVGVISAFVYLYYTAIAWVAYLPILVFPFFLILNSQVSKVSEAKDFDPFLKKWALATFLFSLLFAIGQIFS